MRQSANRVFCQEGSQAVSGRVLVPFHHRPAANPRGHSYQAPHVSISGLPLRSAGAAARRATVRRSASVVCRAELPEGYTPGPEVTVRFEARYETRVGQTVCVVGSSPELGSWKPEAGLALTWHPDHVWKADLRRPKGSLAGTEFKIVIVDQNGGAAWEPGYNRKIEIKEKHVKRGGRVLWCQWGNDRSHVYPPPHGEEDLGTAPQQQHASLATGDEQPAPTSRKQQDSASSSGERVIVVQPTDSVDLDALAARGDPIATRSLDILDGSPKTPAELLRQRLRQVEAKLNAKVEENAKLVAQLERLGREASKAKAVAQDLQRQLRDMRSARAASAMSTLRELSEYEAEIESLRRKLNTVNAAHAEEIRSLKERHEAEISRLHASMADNSEVVWHAAGSSGASSNGASSNGASSNGAAASTNGKVAAASSNGTSASSSSNGVAAAPSSSKAGNGSKAASNGASSGNGAASSNGSGKVKEAVTAGSASSNGNGASLNGNGSSSNGSGLSRTNWRSQSPPRQESPSRQAPPQQPQQQPQRPSHYNWR